MRFSQCISMNHFSASQLLRILPNQGVTMIEQNEYIN